MLLLLLSPSSPAPALALLGQHLVEEVTRLARRHLPSAALSPVAAAAAVSVPVRAVAVGVDRRHHGHASVARQHRRQRDQFRVY